MLDSTISRHQGLLNASTSLGLIELGIFQSALLSALSYATLSPNQSHTYATYLHASLLSALPTLSNTSLLPHLPLDRFSIGTALLHTSPVDPDFHPALTALYDSLAAQLANANGGLVYYANPAMPAAYANLSYLDGMYSLAPFLVLRPRALNLSLAAQYDALEAALRQVQLLQSRTLDGPTDLLRHGYDAARTHAWADPVTGASPVVWGRALGWFTLGLVDALEAAGEGVRGTGAWQALRGLLVAVAEAEVRALQRGREATGAAGVWQVVTRPGDAGNFVEASASSLWVCALLKARRLGFVGKMLGDGVRRETQQVWADVVARFVHADEDGGLRLEGTSAVASLSVEDLGYEYYVSRALTDDALVGEAAFVLAGLEIEQLA